MKKDFNRVSVLALTVGCIALITNFLTYKPNRLVKGFSISLWQTKEGPLYTLLLFLLLIIGFFFSIKTKPTLPVNNFKKQLKYFLPGPMGNLIIIFSFLVAGLLSTEYVKTAGSIVRVSPSVGFWLLLTTGYLYITISIKPLKKNQKTSPYVTNRIDTNPTGGKNYFNSGLSLTLALFSPVIIALLLALGIFNNISVIQEYLAKRDRFFAELIQHLYITGFSITLALIVGIPLGLIMSKSKKLERIILNTVNTIQTIPSLALFGLMIAPLSFLSFKFHLLRDIGISGIGSAPAIIALALYALLPITSNTYTGIKSVDPSIMDAGKGMGMGKVSLFFRVQFPLALPIIFNGVRISTVQTIGNTAVAALIGAGGLGTFIFQGLGQAATDLILLGALPIILLAIITDRIMYLIDNLVTPKGLEAEIS